MAEGRHQAAKEWFGDDGLVIEETILFRAPSVAVRDHVETVQPDLVIMATHGRGPVSRAWIGSVTDRILRQGAAPILCFRPKTEEPPEPGATVPLSKVLVPVDGSPASEQTLDMVPALLGSDVEIHVIRVVDTGRGVPSSYLPQAAQQIREVVDEAEQYLAGLKGAQAEKGVIIATELIKDERPSEGIVAAAEAHGCDVIAMGTRGHGALRRLALGSVTDKVIRMAQRPVLAIPPQG